MPKPTNQIREFARLGATARLREIASEMASIRNAFPDLGKTAKVPSPRKSNVGEVGTRKRRRRKMSAAQKTAVSKRMKAYWAGRRKAKK